ncbi:hypothetical protein M4578_23090 [Salipiger sp. P9]|uniref:hypothetical protein n=1 Tax=Salipiger pentaromativorans TaxID=2943193 RepID=UPI0021580EF9|nr:hypothetical protein [Salipiger pentaromativorans]MCR8550721.1 hypothetical protein [Salipiger pentaromativorans]
MAQAPATPKFKRAALMAAATLSPSLAGRLSPAPSERAALALRRAARGRKRAPAEQVIFLVPLVGPQHVGDWQAVTQRLAGTLESFRRQEGAWQAVICCQERPPLPDDSRLHWLPFTDPMPGNDKWRKLAALCDHLAGMDTGPAYVMSFDADDLLREGTVAEMLERQDTGYLAERGYVMDHATRDVALAGPRSLANPLRKPFWKLCGSCAAVFHDPALPQSAAFLRAMTGHEHRMFPYLARLAGRRLAPLQQPSVLYVLNHGENFGARRGRVGFKTRFVQRYPADPLDWAQAAGEFPAP